MHANLFQNIMPLDFLLKELRSEALLSIVLVLSPSPSPSMRFSGLSSLALCSVSTRCGICNVKIVILPTKDKSAI